VTCHNCRIEMVKAGTYGKNRVQRYKCQQCNRRFSDPVEKPFDADVRLPKEKVVMILHCIVEGNSVRSTARLCGVEKRTVLNYLAMAGENCERFLSKRIKNLQVRDLQLDECWSFVQKKEGHKYAEEQDRTDIGDAYTFIALERTSKLVVAWHLGKRDSENTLAFVQKVRTATNDRNVFEVCTDGGHVPSIVEG
jgi:transposase-like protein